MSKKTRLLIFSYGSILAFICLSLVLYIYFYAIGKKNWLFYLLTLKIFYIPFVLYLLVLSLLIGLLVMASVYFLAYHRISKLEEVLLQLATDNYEQPEFALKNPSTEELSIQENIQKIRKKLSYLSKEVQVLDKRGVTIDGRTEEDILEQERHRLARELHDSVSQQLFAAMMILSALNEQVNKQNADEMIAKQLGTVEMIINESQSEMRALLLHLRPINLEGKSLKKGIEQLLTELTTKIQIELVWSVEDVSLPNNVEDHLFRIIQELLSNTLRHAKAKTLEVYLTKVNQFVLVKMIDDGVGFDVKEKENQAGNYGLKNIYERVASLGGTCKIVSILKNGTSVEIKIPVMSQKKEELKA